MARRLKATHPLKAAYEELKREVRNGHYTPGMLILLGRIYAESLACLNTFERVQLISKVPDKAYFAYANHRRTSRAINQDLYRPEYRDWETLRDLLVPGADLAGVIDAASVTRTLYSMAISFCAAIDLLKEGDQKTPGTFFEHFIATFFTWRVGVEPESSIRILHLDEEGTELPTDFVFDLGSKQRKFHMPIKTSTRERAVMLWAHQKLLDGVYGLERFMGTPVLLAETKADRKRREVVEICLPAQWKVYQLYIARLRRIYYLDLPRPYARLNEDFPPLVVKPFGEFFFEWSTISP
ncbi:MAG TPA: hypothetical protein VHB68_16265 [Steroidobacteraceae bacterium]|nr:hypothetical protein [Steroidobacteraceae bacterium]